MQEICLSVGDVLTIGEYTVRVVDICDDEISFAIDEPGDEACELEFLSESNSVLSLAK